MRIIAQHGDRPVINPRLQLTQHCVQLLAVEQFLPQDLPQSVLHRSDKPLPVATAPGSSVSAVPPLDLLHHQFSWIFSAVKQILQKGVCLLKRLEIVRVNHTQSPTSSNE
ncbi:hypothetical protein T11_10240 [Trichinella zimbabwensis]|uniref:Uncharacterized protein n=1 Tax=Trichinella zimbabwensis TaxID=268475 RepID=A0A0V1I3B8_9BILA|nr:hypothetical protein T11_10240 [Trichinella zimbabwensis]